jgi:hypothetical protein
MGRESSCQQRFNINVWVEIIDAYVTGPYVNTESSPNFLKKYFHYYSRMCIHMWAMACDFRTTVPLLIFHVECASDLTFRTDGLGVEVRSPDLHVLPT